MGEEQGRLNRLLASVVSPGTASYAAEPATLTPETLRAFIERLRTTAPYVPSSLPPVHPRDYLTAQVALGRDPALGEPLTPGDYVTGMTAWARADEDETARIESAVEHAWQGHLVRIRETLATDLGETP